MQVGDQASAWNAGLIYCISHTVERGHPLLYHVNRALLPSDVLNWSSNFPQIHNISV